MQNPYVRSVDKMKKIMQLSQLRMLPIILYLFIPIIFTLFLYPIENKTYLPVEINQEIRITNDKFDPPSIQSIIRKNIGAPFDIVWYDVCFEDYGSKIVQTYKDEQKVMDLDWLIELPSENVSLIHGLKYCKPINSVEYRDSSKANLSYRLMLALTIVPPPNVTSFRYNYQPLTALSIYIKPNEGDLWGKRASVFVASLTIIFLLQNLYKHVFEKKVKAAT